MTLDVGNAPTVAARDPILEGSLGRLDRLLNENPGLTRASIGPRTLLYVDTDWPGELPHNTAIVAKAIEHGADLNAHSSGIHSEKPIHWAASLDNVEVLDYLIDDGADVEASASVIGGGSAPVEAIAFGHWNVARRLVARRAQTTFWQAAPLGLWSRVEEQFTEEAPPAPIAITNVSDVPAMEDSAAAEYLLNRGALDAAHHGGATSLVNGCGRVVHDRARSRSRSRVCHFEN